MKFDHLPKVIHNGINTDIEEEQKALLSSKNELVDQWILFEKDNNYLRFSFKMMIILSCSISEENSWKLSAPHWDCARILPSQRSYIILSV